MVDRLRFVINHGVFTHNPEIHLQRDENCFEYKLNSGKRLKTKCNYYRVTFISTHLVCVCV